MPDTTPATIRLRTGVEVPTVALVATTLRIRAMLDGPIGDSLALMALVEEVQQVDLVALERLAAERASLDTARRVVSAAAADLRDPVGRDEFERRAAAAAERLDITLDRSADGTLWWALPGERRRPVDLDVIEAAADALYLRKGND